MPRVLCALSGGVDSSVAAWLLKEQGFDVVGVFMRNGISGGPAGAKTCCSASDARDAARVADKLDIPFYSMDYSREFGRIIDHFVAEYRRGRTPSPCVLCNQDLKFGHLFEFADAVSAEYVATGHYSRLQEGALLRAKDVDKDQSYFLFGIARESLPRVLFPLGDLSKGEVRELAREAGLLVAEKPESMEICFVPSGDYRDLLRKNGSLSPGRFVDRSGKELGRHQGYEGYTIGQRRGLPALGHPAYVLEIRPESAEVVLGGREELGQSEMLVESCRWLIPEPVAGDRLDAAVQIRAHHEPAAAEVTIQGDGAVRARFDEPAEIGAPGQAAVFYQGERVLGGGWIGRL